jgi:thioester reductase-like protein
MISITDNFFELGGDSLTAIKFQAEALNYKINISYSDIFRYPTIQLLANKHIASNISYADYESNYLNFDYSNINRIISINKTKNIKLLHHSNPKNNNDQNILLLGSTGFLGTHILDAFLSNSSGIAYCIVRHKGSLDESERLRRTLNYYFGNKYDNLINSRIIVINGDIIYDNLKLSDDTYNMLGSKVDIVINSAALVKHYGDYKFFDEVNISGTNNIIKFCKKFSKKLFHVSTVSVSGIHLISDSMHHKQISFNETQLYIGQNLDNTYIYSKFEAEKSILSEIDNGLDACILRIGNISNRYSDAKFQINTLDNAYINRIRAFIELQSIPEDFINHFLEFSPVDFCADAIIKIVFDNPKFNVFHIFNTNLVSIKKFIKILNLLNYNLNIVSEQKFLEKIDTFLSDEKLKPKISGLIPDLDKNKKLNLISNVVPVAEFSTKYLNLLNFKWPKIDIDYFNKYIMYFKNIGYLD